MKKPTAKNPGAKAGQDELLALAERSTAAMEGYFQHIASTGDTRVEAERRHACVQLAINLPVHKPRTAEELVREADTLYNYISAGQMPPAASAPLVPFNSRQPSTGRND